jgi:hypothetical protein
MLNGLRTVIYPSLNLDADRAWWTQLLGKEPYFDQPSYVGFEVAGYELGLLPDAEAGDGAVVYWGVDNVPAAVAAAALGAVEHVPPAEVGGDIVTASVRTPAGTIVGFIDNPHFVGT